MRAIRSDEEFLRDLSELLKAEGISALSVADIAARLRCSRRRLYDLAPTKEGLLLVVAQRLFDNMLQAGFDAAGREADHGRRVAAYANVGVTSTVELSPAFIKDLESSAEGRDIFDRFQLARSKGLRQILDAGMAEGHFNAHNSAVATEVFLATALRIRRSAFLAEAGLTMSEAFEEAYALILTGLLVSPSQRRDAAQHKLADLKPKPRRTR